MYDIFKYLFIYIVLVGYFNDLKCTHKRASQNKAKTDGWCFADAGIGRRESGATRTQTLVAAGWDRNAQVGARGGSAHLQMLNIISLNITAKTLFQEYENALDIFKSISRVSQI